MLYVSKSLINYESINQLFTETRCDGDSADPARGVLQVSVGGVERHRGFYEKVKKVKSKLTFFQKKPSHILQLKFSEKRALVSNRIESLIMHNAYFTLFRFDPLISYLKKGPKGLFIMFRPVFTV